MKNAGKWMKLALFFFVVGAVFVCASFAGAGFSFENLGAVEMIETTLTLDGEFENISVLAQVSDVKFEISSDGKTSIVLKESEKYRHRAEISENTLYVDTVDAREWFDRFFWNFGKMSVTVRLPESAYQSVFIDITTGDVFIGDDFTLQNLRIECTTGDVLVEAGVQKILNIKTTTGDAKIEGVHAQDVSVEVTTGDAILSDIRAENIKVRTTTGKIRLTKALADDALDCECTTGGIRFDACDAGKIRMVATTGDIMGTFLTEKEFSAKATTGSVQTPFSKAGGGPCSLVTTTGSIDVAIGG